MTISPQARRGEEAAGSSGTAFRLEYDKGSLSLPVRPVTEGPAGIDVSSLLKETGHVAVDPGYANTASCASAITYIDGEAGILRYRGYPIEQLAEKSTFLEVAYLLIYGELPTRNSSTTSPRKSPSTRCCARRCGSSSRASRGTPTRWPCSPRR